MNLLLRTLAVSCVVAPIGAQEPQEPSAIEVGVDPYTRGDAKRMQRAGYVSFGPFAWGDRHSTTQIEQKLGDIGLRWVETEHFRVGSSLTSFRVSDGDRPYQKRLAKEVRRLRKRLPRVPQRVRILDPWLRLHLFAQRAEELYADFAKRVRWKPPPPVDDAPPPPGEGPWLGMRGKFTLLLFQRHTSLARYTRVFLEMNKAMPRRWHSTSVNSGLFVTAADVYEGALIPDAALHCNVTFGLAFNLVDCYRGNVYGLPVWLTEGVAHWYSRRVDRKWSNYTAALNFPRRPGQFQDWERFVRLMVKRDEATPASKLLEWLDYTEFDFRHHLTSWSRVDFLMQRSKDGFGVFLDHIKGQRTRRGWPISESHVLACQARGLQKAWKLDAARFDDEWKKFVIKRYRAKK